MAFELNQIVPWGRSYDEYVAMFSLSPQDLEKSLLGCGDGPSSFNCELTERGGSIISFDPIYTYRREEIRKRIDATFDEIMAQTRDNKQEFVWKQIGSLEELGRIRMEAMHRFLSDYDCGKSQGRYRAESLPFSSFRDGQSDLALCSHLLFLYSGRLDLGFHINAVAEMCRVAQEVRIFPLLQLGSTPSPHVRSVVDHFESAGYEVDRVRVPYEFQRGGDQMLRIRRSSSNIVSCCSRLFAVPQIMEI